MARGVVVTPHHLASDTAASVLRRGGNAIEAIFAAAITIAVVSPHDCTIGGDGFWLLMPPNRSSPLSIDGGGPAGSSAMISLFPEGKMPARGPRAVLTVPGVVGSWLDALEYSRDVLNGTETLPTLMSDGIEYATDGFPVGPDLSAAIKSVSATIGHVVGDLNSILRPNGTFLGAGDILKQPRLGDTLRRLSIDGLDSFYRGRVKDLLVSDFDRFGIPIADDDLEEYKARRLGVLQLNHSKGEIFNLEPPMAGTVSLAILGILDRLRGRLGTKECTTHPGAATDERWGLKGADGGDAADTEEAVYCGEGRESTLNIADDDLDSLTVHRIVEATKLGFDIRDGYMTDPDYMDTSIVKTLLDGRHLDQLAASIDDAKVSQWPRPKILKDGGTVWMGAIDKNGFVVSYQQSIYHHFGSAVVSPATGVLFNNRGQAFSLDSDSLQALIPNKRPYHTLNPAGARLKDGRVMAYGTMGGDGQPQTQAAIFERYVMRNISLTEAVSRPRWVLGQCYGESTKTGKLSLEGRWSRSIVEELKAKGHQIKILDSFSAEVGYAGSVVLYPNGTVEGAYDPRSDGSVIYV